MAVSLSRDKAKFLVLVISLVLLIWLGRYLPVDIKGIQDTLVKFPLIYSGVIFVVIYVVLTFFIWFSKDLLRLMSAVLFGAYISTLFVFIAETINACCLFSLARYLGRGFVQRSLGARNNSFDNKLGGLNFVWLFLLRATPLVAFRFLDLAAGLTRIPARRYLLAVILGSPLRIFWVQYILAGVGKNIFSSPFVIAEYLLQHKILLLLSIIYFILVILVAVKLRKRG